MVPNQADGLFSLARSPSGNHDLAPSLAKATAAAWPMPEVPPVTMATFPWKSFMVVLSFLLKVLGVRFLLSVNTGANECSYKKIGSGFGSADTLARPIPREASASRTCQGS
jgi:hypothetical protein